nr:MAG TPA_asm: hypothetical protein [Caudoviricetes sp.]
MCKSFFFSIFFYCNSQTLHKEPPNSRSIRVLYYKKVQISLYFIKNI